MKKLTPIILIILILFLSKSLCLAQQKPTKAEMPGPLIVLANSDEPKKVWVTTINPEKKLSRIYELYFSGSYIGNNSAVSLFIGDKSEDGWVSIKKSVLSDLGYAIPNDETPTRKFFLTKGEYLSYNKELRFYNHLDQIMIIKLELKE